MENSRWKTSGLLAVFGVPAVLIGWGLSLNPSWLPVEARPVLGNFLLVLGLAWIVGWMLWAALGSIKVRKDARLAKLAELEAVRDLEAGVNHLRAERRQKIPEIVVQFDHLERSGLQDSWRIKKIDQLADEVHRTLPESIRGNWKHRITVARRGIAEVADGVKPVEDLREHVRVFASLADLDHMIKPLPDPEHSKE